VKTKPYCPNISQDRLWVLEVGFTNKTQIMYFKVNTARQCAAAVIFLFVFSALVRAQVLDSTRQRGAITITVTSKVLGEKRKIFFQTPSQMNEFDRYPVLYLLDGEALTTMVGGQVQYLSEAYKIIPNMIVVGIQNTDRTRDLTPTHSIIGPDGKPDTSSNAFGKNIGGGERFLEFIHSELQPLVDARYPTAPFRILAGHSLGGLMAVHCLVHHPDYFNAYLAISPSLQWDDRALLKQIERTTPSIKDNKRLLFFCDANEDAAFHQNQITLDSLLKAGKLNVSYKRLFYPEETHISEPVKALYDALRFVYPAWHLPYNSSAFKKTMNAKIIRDHYRELSMQYGYNVVPLHDEINQIARFLSNDPNRVSDAIELLEMNAQNYPGSAAVQELLGDVWVKKGAPSKAYICYQKAAQLAPVSETLNRKLKDTQN
jgi:hypothetical protein